MKNKSAKTLASILTLSLILCSLTACQEGGAENLPGAQGSVTDSTVSDNDNSSSDPESSSSDPESSSTNKGDDSAPESSDSTPDEPKEMGIYGETEIPDIPCGDPDYEGKANTMSNHDALEQCLDSMVFETHTYGEYTVKLVGESVRTDKKNFPDSIYTQGLHVEVEKNGKEIEAFNNYGSLYLQYGTQYHLEYRLFTDKIGSYLDLYDLDTPVIAFRYFFDEDPGREVTKTVSFAMIWNDKLYAKLVGTTVKGTGIEFNPDSDLYPITDTKKVLSLTTSGGLDIEVLFAADEFKIADGKTLIDEKAGIKYTFDFTDPLEVEGKIYKTEWIK